MRKIPAVSSVVAAIGFVAALSGAGPASAESCPGNPDALGTSRTIVVSPQEYQRVGSMQYKQTLPLTDHEVVLTFDDGPLPPWSDRALEILKSQCVKVAYFIVGEMAHVYPDVVRREYEAGDTIGTHSMTHPIFQRADRRQARLPDRRGHRLGRGGARRSERTGAVLPHPRLWPLRYHREGARRSIAGRVFH